MNILAKSSLPPSSLNNNTFHALTSKEGDEEERKSASQQQQNNVSFKSTTEIKSRTAEISRSQCLLTSHSSFTSTSTTLHAYHSRIQQPQQIIIALVILMLLSSSPEPEITTTVGDDDPLTLFRHFSTGATTGIYAQTTTGSDTSGGAQQCPQWVNEEIQQCVQPVAEFARTLNRQQLEEQQDWQQNNADKQNSESAHQRKANSAVDGNGGDGSLGSRFGSALQWPTKLGGQVFHDLCRLINEFELCVDGYRDKCRHHITTGLIEASYGFLCNEGYETFIASAECLIELDQQPNVKSCHDRTLREIEEANNEQNGTVNTKLNKMCNALNYFSNCVQPSITNNCGFDAWKVIFRVLKDTTRTLMPLCHFEDDNTENGWQTAMDNKKAQSSFDNRNNDGIEYQQRHLDVTSYDEVREKFGKPDGMRSWQTSTVANGPVADWEHWEEEKEQEEDEVHWQVGSQEDYANGGKQNEITGVSDDRKHTPSPSDYHQVHYGSYYQHQSQQSNEASVVCNVMITTLWLFVLKFPCVTTLIFSG